MIFVVIFHHGTLREAHRSSWGGYNAPPPKLPSQLGDLVSSFYVLAGISAADFHRQRTGEGQEVQLSYTGCALWGQGAPLPYYLTRWQTIREAHRAEPCVGFDWLKRQMPFYASMRTKEGAWVMLTAGSQPRLMRDLKTLGVYSSSVLKLVSCVVKSILTGGSVFEGALEGFTRFSEPIARSVEKLSLSDLRRLYDEKDFWWCPILKSEAVFQSQQAFDSGAISAEGDILSPVKLTTNP